jgi:dihydrofolate synthase/folylpolyglutamate synthase
MGLERVESVRARLGVELSMPIITVGGTNGKGSVCAYLDAMLRHAGYRTALYTSPHLLRYNERVHIDGVEASDAAFVDAFERIERARGDVSLTYFEFGTLAAALLFADERVDACVLEVGLGGRLDAVNIFDPDCAVVVTVDLDHMNFLGDTREAIGREKAGIFRAGRPAVCAEKDVPHSVREHARSIGARLLILGEDFGCQQDLAQWRYWGPVNGRGALPMPAMRGHHQLNNAAAAITALDTLKPRISVGMQAIRTGLVTASVPGRFQVLPGRPVIVLDVAHNPHAARALADNLRSHKPFKRTLGVFGMLGDKDIAGVIEAVKRQIDEWYVASLDIARGITSTALAALVRQRDPNKPLREFQSPAAAFQSACQAAGDDDRILVFGSFHTVADVMAVRASVRK